MERMLAGLSTRRYAVGRSRSARRSTENLGDKQVGGSRRFVARPRPRWPSCFRGTVRAGPRGADDRRCAPRRDVLVVALGIDIDGNKHPLALVEGSTENATLVRGLLVGLRERGLDVTRPMLVGIDGAKALRRRWSSARSPGHPTLPTAQDPN